MLPGFPVFFPAIPSPLLSLEFTAGLPSGVSVSRASGGGYHNSSGIFVWDASTNTLRVTYDPATLVNLGAWIEGARTNLILQSAFASGWSTTALTITANAVTSPENATTGATLTEGSGTAEHSAYTTTPPTVTVGSTYTYSWHLKGTARRYLQQAGGGTNTGSFAAVVDTSNWSIVATGATGIGVYASSLIKAYPSNWYRVSVSGQAGLTTGYSSVQGQSAAAVSLPGSSNGSQAWNGWGAQAELGAFPSSHIPTTTASVTRSADILTCSTASLLSAASLVVAFRTAPGAGLQVIYQDDDATENNRRRIHRAADTHVHVIYSVSGVDQCDIDLGATTNDTDYKVAIRGATNDFAASLNGGAVGTDGSGTLPTTTGARFGVDASGNYMFGTIKYVRAYPLLMNNQLQVLSL